MNNTFKERVSGKDVEFSTTGSGLKGERKELRNLGADMLGEVFSYLPQKELFEVLVVSKNWKKAVMEGSGLWRKVDVCRKWNLGGEGRDMRENEILRRVIGFAEDVSFSKTFRRDDEHAMSVGRWLAPNLRILKMPFECVLPTFFPLLVSKCPLLESLVVEAGHRGTADSGTDPVHIRHPKLKSLKISSYLPLVLTGNCPALTHLSALGELNFTMRADSNTLYAPSLFCPGLKSLCLSRTQCTKGVLEAVAAHAPNINSLEASISEESPFTALTHFKALRVLKIRQCIMGGAIPSNAFTSWPLLESLQLNLSGSANGIVVAHVGLKSLEIYDSSGAMSPVLSCVSLEHLKLYGEIFKARCLKNLDQFCPKLKTVEIGRYLSTDGIDEFGDEDEADGPLEIVHERMEELVLRKFSRSSVRVACTNLKKLVMKWGHPVRPTVSATLRFPTLECPKLKSLELSAYDHMFRRVPGMLSVLPRLESLRCECAREDFKNVVLEHQNLRDIVVVMTRMRVRPAGSKLKLKRLILVMPSLVQVEVVESIERVLVVKER